MSKSVLISIRPQWCEKIANGEKTIEVRKSRPKLETPFKCYVYCTKDKEHTLFKDWIDPPFVEKEYNIMRGKNGKNVFADHRPWGNANGKVIGEFVCDALIPISIEYSDPNSKIALKEFPYTRLTDKGIIDYLGNGKDGYGWHISALQIYEKPKELSEFTRCDKCPYGPIERCNEHEFSCDGIYSLRRPPQSWCYVEDLDAK